MGKTLYLECNTGISGDMFVAALIGLGADQETLCEILKTIPVTGTRIEINEVQKSGIVCMDFNVIPDETHENHDHDMEYLYGKAFHEGRHRHQEHRTLLDVTEILKASSIPPGALKTAIEIFGILAKAEGKVHGKSADQVYFHEVGAVDSIMDIAAAAICLDMLNITDVIIPKLTEGTGTVRCAHGILPIPVPAVVDIVSEYGIPLEIVDRGVELVTPTGAAIAAAICTGRKLPETFVVRKVGYGAGKREYEIPGILRAFLIVEEKNLVGRDTICKLECNIDDSTGEILGHAMEALFEAGARDVHFIPLYMKKNRPSYQLNVICSPKEADLMENIIFCETTTIGIRRVFMDRKILKRESRMISTSFGDLAVKICTLPNGQERTYPEYSEVARLAQKNGIPYPEMLNKIMVYISGGV